MNFRIRGFSGFLSEPGFGWISWMGGILSFAVARLESSDGEVKKTLNLAFLPGGREDTTAGEKK
jgi:hypothetical protein